MPHSTYYAAAGRAGVLLGLVAMAILDAIPATPGAWAQSAESAKSPYGKSAPGLITIRLEKRVGTQATKVSQNTVFRTGDILRFQLTSSMAGYLYVVDKGSTGTTSTLFPGSSDLHGDNRIEPRRGYLVPADGNGWFEVTGPAGFDVLYFLVSATPMNLAAAAAPETGAGTGIGAGTGAAAQGVPAPAPALSPSLLPRCNDEIFKSRGECLDDSAGPAALPPDAPLPREIGALASAASRDIILSEDETGTTVRPAATAKLPLVYTFRLAHR
jgi:hypothetical protein